MSQRKLILLVIAAAAVLFTLISFAVLRHISGKGARATGINKAELIYKRAEGFLRANEEDKAVNALFEIINEYPASKYAEQSLKTLATVYMNKADHSKARYYYKRLLRDFPGVNGADSIKAAIEELNMKEMMSPVVITDDSVEYVVQPGDSLYAIAKSFNTTIGLIKKINNLQGDIIRPGQKLKVVVARFSILVDKATNTLLLKKDGEPLKTYIVSTGKDNSTPVGSFKIEEKMVRPVWYKVDAVVAPDSDQYELGERWMGLSAQGYGIHGTADESTIGSQVTQGCVRMKNAEVVELYDIVPSGTEVDIIDSAEKPAAAQPAATPGQ